MKKYIEIIGLGPPNLEEVAKQFWLADDTGQIPSGAVGMRAKADGRARHYGTRSANKLSTCLYTTPPRMESSTANLVMAAVAQK